MLIIWSLPLLQSLPMTNPKLRGRKQRGWGDEKMRKTQGGALSLSLAALLVAGCGGPSTAPGTSAKADEAVSETPYPEKNTVGRHASAHQQQH
ncbi:MAG: hypothetical protein HC788_01820 [Sphingopyxis sp.]|nr:hypothetical protein [Sphingopyxis sp.]